MELGRRETKRQLGESRRKKKGGGGAMGSNGNGERKGEWESSGQGR